MFEIYSPDVKNSKYGKFHINYWVKISSKVKADFEPGPR